MKVPLLCISVSSSVFRRIKDRRNNPRRGIKKQKFQKRQEVRETNVQRMKNGRTCRKEAKDKKKKKNPSALRHPLYVVNLLLSSASSVVLVLNDLGQS